jgi:hypothetical protein
MPQLEQVPAEEAKQIENIIRLTLEELTKRYSGEKPRLRAQHSKGHACVTATFTVAADLPPDKRVGLFANPGREYEAWVRYSNAAAVAGADSLLVKGVRTHGSRGMAVKILGVSGVSLLPHDGPGTQDFLMVNHPVFPFPDTEVYNAITEVLAANNGDATLFFTGRLDKDAHGAPNLAGPLSRQTMRTRQIIQRIQSLSFTPVPPANAPTEPSAYQAPPASPVDNEYFGAAPFLFGEDAAMRFSARPRSPVAGESLNLTDEDYLRAALRERLAVGAQDVVFDFQVQVRKASELAASIEADIEDACVDWDPTVHPFKTMATITIPPQEFDTEERRAHCENLFFTPWHGIVEHRPLGGINRLRRAVYEASSKFRHSQNGAVAP